MRIAAILFLLVFPTIAQENSHAIKSVDDYCIAISKIMDDMDTRDEQVKPVLPNLPAVERPKVVEYLKWLHVLRLGIRRDACEAKDLKSARAATNRDLSKMDAQTEAMLAYAKHGLAEAYRQKARSQQESSTEAK